MTTPDNILTFACEEISKGARFYIDFPRRSLKINNRFLIENGETTIPLGINTSTNPLYDIESAYSIYHHSVPSERSERNKHTYFSALPEQFLDADDLLYGQPRELARFNLEYLVLAHILLGDLKWDNFAAGKWFWKSNAYPSLILLKQWIQPVNA